MEPYAIFFSYKREDEPLVRRVYNDLRTRAVRRVWLDVQRLQPGEQWEAECTQAILECSHMVVFISQSALRSEQVQREYELACAYGKTVIPVRIDPSVPYVQFPSLLMHYHGINLDSEATYDIGVGELARILPRYSSILPSMMHVERGPFVMGGPGYEHIIDIDEYWIGKWTITVGEYDLFIKAGGLTESGYWPTGITEAWLRSFPHARYLPASNIEDYALKHPSEPVRGITWAHAYAYCEWLNAVSNRPSLFQLPTEAQWEKAARGTDARMYPWGNAWVEGVANTSELAWGHATDCGQLGHAGDSPIGCQDMSGNVWEWTSSRPLPLPYVSDGTRESHTKDDEPRIIRGGSWIYPRSEARTFTRASEQLIPQMYRHEIGFRIVATATYSSSDRSAARL